jgi:ATP-dependent helicase HrpB
MDFPVLEQLDLILDSIHKNSISILQAPPGSGKTTCLPLELMKAKIAGDKKILMLEPRRIAAKNAALRLSFMNGSQLGKEIGYRIRFDSNVTDQTKLEVVTDGILTKLLLADPELNDYGLIVFDEFHERNLDSDFCLALTRRAQTHFRNDLKILIMSATLEGIHFEKAGILTKPIASSGKIYPVEVIYQGSSPKRQSVRLAELIPKALERHEGDILVFFSGISEINETEKALANTFSTQDNVIVHKLYGDMSFEDQEKVFLHPKQNYRKVILATNLAESSITISNVRVIIDTGYCKRVIYDPSSGLTKLERKRISLASAKQRSGRSGREAAGYAYRLWSQEEEANFVTAHLPEILETDISNLILLSKLWGENLNDLPLLDYPSEGTILEMTNLLTYLGCLDAKGSLSDIGKHAAQLPIPLRIAVMCLKMAHNGLLQLGVDIATVYTERRIFSEQTQSQNFSRIWEKWENLTSINSYPKLKLIREQLAQILKNIELSGEKLAIGNTPSTALVLSLAYPDRISKSRQPSSNRYKMSGGKGAYFPEGSSIQHPDWILVLETDGNDTDAKINLYCELDEKEVLDLYKNQILSSIEHTIEENEKTMPILRSYEEQKLGEIVLKRINSSGLNSLSQKKQAIYDYFQKKGILNILSNYESTKQLLYRTNLLFKNGILEKEIKEESLLANLETWLFPNYSFGKDSLNLLNFDPYVSILSLFSYKEKELIQNEAPTHLTVPSGSKIEIQYSEGIPVLAVKLQELFGLAETPRIAKGRVYLTLHLLSPAGRPVQVTKDLKNFWDSTYHEVKKELKGRYPKHPWPDSPWEAQATKGIKKRSLN